MAVATAIAISAGVSALSAYYASRKQTQAAHEAGTIQGQAADAALAYEKEKDAREQAQYAEERARLWAQQDEDRKTAALNQSLALEDRSRRIALSKPYTDLGGASATSLLALMRGGDPNQLMLRQGPTVPYPVPAGGSSRALPLNADRSTSLAGVPSATQNTAPFTVPDESLAALATRRS